MDVGCEALGAGTSRSDRPLAAANGRKPHAGQPSGTVHVLDAVALESAMERWGDTVLRLATSRMGSVADAEDVFQTVFMRLLQSRERFTDDEHLKAWLLRVTVNRCRDLARSGWKRRTVALDPEWDAPDAAAHDDEDAAVWDAVGQLPEQQRTAVHLHYVEGYSTEEIASALDCRPATARTWLFRARARIRELLEADAAVDAPATLPNSGNTSAAGGAPTLPRPPNAAALTAE